MQTHVSTNSQPRILIAGLGEPTDLIMNVSLFKPSSGNARTVRIQVLTVSGFIYQHKKSFVEDTPTLMNLFNTIKYRVQEADYCVSVLDSTWWNDVTDLEINRQMVQGS